MERNMKKSAKWIIAVAMAASLACLQAGCSSSQGKSGDSSSGKKVGGDKEATAKKRGGVDPRGGKGGRGKFGDLLNGYGSYIYSNGDKYTGEFENGLRHGKGAFEYQNGDSYKGEFKDDMKHGKGTYYWVNGDSYTGTFENGKRVGKGVYAFEDGHVLTGEFTQDGKKGQGRLVERKTKKTMDCKVRNWILYCKNVKGAEKPIKKTQ